jgi:GT2 family glycosyltransferase
MNSHYRRVAVIVLDYFEGNDDTLEALRIAGYDIPIIWAHRDGVGAMSRAFNNACDKILLMGGIEYIWFITNVTFPPNTMRMLIQTLDEDMDCAAVQPAMRNSDHPHLRVKGVEKVPFIEWTAPMLRVDALREIGLPCSEMGYVHFDMEWCYRAMQHGYNVKVDGRCEIHHNYLHSSGGSNFWTTTRREMRRRLLESSAQALAREMGFPYRGLPDAEKVAREQCNKIFLASQNKHV